MSRCAISRAMYIAIPIFDRFTALDAGDDIAQAIQLEIEYDPRPPLDAGSPEAAGEAIAALLPVVTRVERKGA